MNQKTILMKWNVLYLADLWAQNVYIYRVFESKIMKKSSVNNCNRNIIVCN